MRSLFSKTVTVCPARLSCCAAARPAGPDPTIATERPVRRSGRTGWIQPSFQPRRAISHSICLMVTASSLIPSTQAASHGAGQSSPVHSGKLLVECRRRSASSHLSW